MSRPQNIFWTLSRPQKQPIRAQKSQTDPKIKSNLKVKNEENIEIESYSTSIRTQNPKIAHQGPKIKKWLQNEAKSKSQNWENHRKWKLFNCMSWPQISIWIQIRLQKKQVRAPKSQKRPEN